MPLKTIKKEIGNMVDLKKSNVSNSKEQQKPHTDIWGFAIVKRVLAGHTI